MGDKEKFNKLYRQLIILHIFLASKVIEFSEIINSLAISKRTINRDIKELQHAGLLKVKFSKKENGYVHIDDSNRCPFSAPIYTGSKINNLHLDKLIRLAIIMKELRDHREVPYDDDDYINQETCRDWYKRRFPNKSLRTMQRDFLELGKIKYEIKYEDYARCYTVDFPEGLEAVEYMIEIFEIKK